jgi:hypothetical protein
MLYQGFPLSVKESQNGTRATAFTFGYKRRREETININLGKT